MNFDVQQIKNNNDYLVFFKIVENEHVDSITKNGQIYFGTLAKYREMEKVENKKSIGDQSEASLTHKVSEYIVFEDEIHEIHGKTNGHNIRINNNQCAFCFYALGMKNFDKIAENKIIHIIPYDTLSKMCADKGGINNCSVVIFYSEVIQKIYFELRKRNLCYAGGRVEYDDFDYIPKHDINTVAYSIEAAYHKEKKYSYQNEFRIVTINNDNKPLKDLYIDVDKDDFMVVKLKDNSSFCCEITYDIAHQEGRTACVEFTISNFIKQNSME